MYEAGLSIVLNLFFQTSLNLRAINLESKSYFNIGYQILTFER